MSNIKGRGIEMKGLLVIFSGFLMVGCACVKTDREWSRLEQCVVGGTELIWVESCEDEERVNEIVKRDLSEPLSMERAVGVGLINNKKLQGVFEEIGIGKADLVQAGLIKNPSLSALLRFPTSGGGTNVEADGFVSISELWLLPMRKKVAEAAMEKTLMYVADRVLATKRDIKQGVSDVYFKKQILKEVTRYYEEMVNLSKEAKRRHEFGYMTDMDVYLAEQAESEALIMVDEGMAHLKIEKARLAQVMGVQANEFDVGDHLERIGGYEGGLEEALELAFKNRFDVWLARMRVCERARMYELSKRMVFKEVHGGVTFERELDGKKLLGPVVDLELPLFDQNQAQIAKAEYMVRQARKELMSLEDEVRMNVGVYIEEVGHLRFKEKVMNEKVIPLQEKVVGFVEEWNSQMQINRFILLEAKRDLVMLRVDRLKVEGELWRQILGLEYNLGGSLK